MSNKTALTTTLKDLKQGGGALLAAAITQEIIMSWARGVPASPEAITIATLTADDIKNHWNTALNAARFIAQMEQLPIPKSS